MLDKPTKQENLFKIPENYFENFNVEIMDKLPVKKQVKVVPLWRKVLPWTAVAAVLSGVIISIGLFNKSDDMIANQIGDSKDSMSAKNLASTSVSLSGGEADEYFQYLKEEATVSSYRDIMYNDY